MSRSKVEGTKIAQAAKDLNVTSVTIRRYIQEFNIDTATDENGIKVLPAQALIELQEIRKLKEDGLTNPQVLESLDELRQGKGDAKTSKAKPKAKVKAKAKDAEAEIDEQDDQEQEESPKLARSKAKVRGKSALRGKKGKAARETEPEQDQESSEDEEEIEDSISGNEAKSLDARRVKTRKSRHSDDADETQSDDEHSPSSDTTGDENETGDEDADMGEDGDKSKHSLTCQTCGKTFEHMNPRLRDCLECYRAKRKERRRGGDKHKKVIENPIAQQVLNKQRGDDKAVALAPERERSEKPERSERPERAERQERSDRSLERQERQERLEREKQERLEARAVALAAQPRHQDPTPWAQMQKPVRSYRKAIEETRLITGSLKRRLERPDLPEGERRWLEQVYAYQLILHQGWRHLAEYKSGGTNSSPKTEE